MQNRKNFVVLFGIVIVALSGMALWNAQTRPEGAPEKARHADYGRADDCAGLHRVVCAVRGVYRRVGDDDSAAAACIAGVDGSRSGGRLDEGSQASFRRPDPVAEDHRLVRGVPWLLGLVLLHAGEQSAAAVYHRRTKEITVVRNGCAYAPENRSTAWFSVGAAYRRDLRIEMGRF